jgi:microsomal dipeptidase-like Zn-dependent dipeptidase
MIRRLSNIVIYTLVPLAFLYVLMRLLVAPLGDRMMNPQVAHRPYEVPAQAAALHDRLTIMDWHADSLLWDRDILSRHSYGHVDVPRLQAGNVALQMFTTVTKTPRGQNLGSNDADSDNITLLAFIEGWPVDTWSSLRNRALYQAEKLDRFIAGSDGALWWVRNRRELAALLSAREGVAAGARPVGALLGMEGAHPLEGDLANIERFYNAGYRMIALTHFFDNELGGSLHGEAKGGLTDFGKAAVAKLDAKGIIIDLAHASEQTAWDTLAIATRPMVVSHTGLHGHCGTKRNVSDDLMKAIAGKGGLIAVGFWEAAVCADTPDGIAGAIRYAVELVGEDHVALGSDWDGTIRALTAEDLAAITASLAAGGMPESVIAKVMGGNSARFLATWLPE